MSHLMKYFLSFSCRCGKPKKRAFALCRPCFLFLPHSLRPYLYQAFGYGFEQAYEHAAEYLKKNGKWSHLVE
ncbi:hypothetical protein LCGC14_0867650 [marine sediment metagenome]|uniref:Uncharacterized protein n=1 Tax=marine sediment metagenome TaxID=412755 RepID=A0A0F9PR95_9ZZZZ|nr:hypothetical protein [Desulfobacterales bacterium]